MFCNVSFDIISSIYYIIIAAPPELCIVCRYLDPLWFVDTFNVYLRIVKRVQVGNERQTETAEERI